MPRAVGDIFRVNCVDSTRDSGAGSWGPTGEGWGCGRGNRDAFIAAPNRYLWLILYHKPPVLASQRTSPAVLLKCSEAPDGFSYIYPNLHITSTPWACPGASWNNGCCFHGTALQRFADSSSFCLVSRLTILEESGWGRVGCRETRGFKRDSIAFRWVWSWAVCAWEALSLTLCV